MVRNTWQDWTVGGFHFVGGSVAGVATSLQVKELDICFDVANGPFETLMSRRFFITHGHMDHAAGIPYVISQHALNNLPSPEIHMPVHMLEPLQKIMKLWCEIEGFEYQTNFHGVAPGAEIPLKGDHFVRVFETVHRVPSVGYAVFRRVKKLKPEFLRLGKDEIIRRRNKGEAIENVFEEPVLAFTGDTQIEVFDRVPWLSKVKTLVVEVTYLDERKPVTEARKWGHIHLDEILPRISQLQCENVVMIHQSRRYSVKEIRQILSERLDPKDRLRVTIAPYFK